MTRQIIQRFELLKYRITRIYCYSGVADFVWSSQRVKEIKFDLSSPLQRRWISKIVAVGGYLDPKGTQRRGGLDARMTNRRQIINLSIHGWFLLPFPPLWRTIAAVGAVFCAKYAEYWILPSLLESRGISCLPLAIYFRLPLSSPFIVFFSLPFREKAWYMYIYIYGK